MRRFRTASIFFACIALAALTSRAAQADQKSDAARLFKEGQELMKAQRFADACPKFEDSQKLDQQLGTVLNLGFCLEKLGSTWLSWLAYRDAELRAESVGKRDRAEFARQHLSELEKNLPKVAIDCGPDKIDELQVEGRTVPGANNGQSFALESGRRTFKFIKSGKKTASVEVSVKQSGNPKINCPSLADDLAPPTPPPAGTGAPGTEDLGTPEKPAPPPPEAAPSRAPMWISFGVAAAGIATGSVFGVLTLQSKNDAASGCHLGTDGKQQCNAGAEQKISDANTFSWVSNIGFGVGVVAAAVGVYFLVTTPSAAPPPKDKDTESQKSALFEIVPSISPHGSGAMLVGRF